MLKKDLLPSFDQHRWSTPMLKKLQKSTKIRPVPMLPKPSVSSRSVLLLMSRATSTLVWPVFSEGMVLAASASGSCVNVGGHDSATSGTSAACAPSGVATSVSFLLAVVGEVSISAGGPDSVSSSGRARSPACLPTWVSHGPKTASDERALKSNDGQMDAVSSLAVLLDSRSPPSVSSIFGGSARWSTKLTLFLAIGGWFSCWSGWVVAMVVLSESLVLSRVKARRILSREKVWA
mmetsp:Transcript_5040/g.11779  ORF Transcript_5040/g.11779 Transcript_5040/m.11779 type:complete len:235 (+) Transcript_5040:756-1460(+)